MPRVPGYSLEPAAHILQKLLRLGVLALPYPDLAERR